MKSFILAILVIFGVWGALIYELAQVFNEAIVINSRTEIK